jgi:hypothetical protein
VAAVAVSVTGSDCPTGKIQFATFDTADTRARSLHRRRGGSARPYHCAWCGCWHLGNRRADSSKGRQRR